MYINFKKFKLKHSFYYLILITIVISTLQFNVSYATYEPDIYPGIPKPIIEKGGKTVEITPGPSSTGDQSPMDIHQYFFETFLPYFTKGAAGIIGALCVVFIIYSGIQYLIAYGDEEKIQTAKRTLIYAAVGLILVMLSYSIVSIISNLPLPEGTPTP